MQIKEPLLVPFVLLLGVAVGTVLASGCAGAKPQSKPIELTPSPVTGEVKAQVLYLVAEDYDTYNHLNRTQFGGRQKQVGPYTIYLSHAESTIFLNLNVSIKHNATGIRQTGYGIAEFDYEAYLALLNSPDIITDILNYRGWGPASTELLRTWNAWRDGNVVLPGVNG
jgi:hypothetical protein